MEPYYILRLLPPLGYSRKLRFESVEDLLFTLSNLYAFLNIDFLPISDNELIAWKKDKLGHFCDCLVVTCVRPIVCEKHEEYFINTPPGKTIPIESLLFTTPQPKPLTEYKTLQRVS